MFSDLKESKMAKYYTIYKLSDSLVLNRVHHVPML